MIEFGLYFVKRLVAMEISQDIYRLWFAHTSVPILVCYQRLDDMIEIIVLTLPR